MWYKQPHMTMPATVPLIVPNAQLAVAYVPIQCFTVSFSSQEALKMGTMFPELYSPYEKEQDNRRCMPCQG